jgi:hypothetical protein
MYKHTHENNTGERSIRGRGTYFNVMELSVGKGGGWNNDWTVK